MRRFCVYTSSVFAERFCRHPPAQTPTPNATHTNTFGKMRTHGLPAQCGGHGRGTTIFGAARRSGKRQGLPKRKSLVRFPRSPFCCAGVLLQIRRSGPAPMFCLVVCCLSGGMRRGCVGVRATLFCCLRGCVRSQALKGPTGAASSNMLTHPSKCCFSPSGLRVWPLVEYFSKAVRKSCVSGWLLRLHVVSV